MVGQADKEIEVVSPSTYYSTAGELEAVKARAFLFLMSDEVVSIKTPLAEALFDMVCDMTVSQAYAAIGAYEAMRD